MTFKQARGFGEAVKRATTLALTTASLLALGAAACGGVTRDPNGAPAAAGRDPAGAGGGQAGGAGGQAGGAGSSGAASGPLERLFENAQAFGGGLRRVGYECSADGSCPVGMSCFRLARELAVCDVPHELESDQCTVGGGANMPPDQCGCGGLSCPSGQNCIAASTMCACQGLPYNACVDAPCSSATDCASPSVCTPPSFIQPLGAPESFPPAVGRCIRTGCASDADCTIDSGGRCSVVMGVPAQAVLSQLDVACAYPGSASDPGVCRGMAAAALRGRNDQDFHRCFMLNP